MNARADTGVCALDLLVELGADGASRLAARRATHPWSIGRGFPGGRGRAVTLIPQSAGGGLLPGETVRQRVRVGAGASARLLSAGATLVYGSERRPDAENASEWRFDVAGGGGLVVAAEPHVLIGPARFALRQTAVVAPDACFVACDGLVVAAPFAGAWRTRLTIRRPNGAVVFEDRQTATEAALRRAAKAGWTAFGAVVAIAPEAHASRLERALPPGPLDLGTGIWAAAARLRCGAGIGVRLAAADGGRLRAALTTAAARAGAEVAP